MTVVVDASTALAAVLPDDHSTFARAAIGAGLDEGLIVPTLWMYEIQNGLVMALRRNRIDAMSAGEALEALRAVPAEMRAPHRFGQEFRLARAHALSAYDAAYLAVALETGARLATSDKQLHRAAVRSGIAVFQA